jgi:enamine deaminase RidA (YjgF/YER057c/UK114 family)
MMTEVPPLKMMPVEQKAKGADARLEELGISLPTAAAPIASYVPTVEAGGMLYVSGQIAFKDGHLMTGRLGDDRVLEYGQDAARACGLMVLAQAKAALGSLDRIARVVKLNVFVNSTERFTDQPSVANGASDLMIDVFGEAGRHARAAVGVAALPRDSVVEVDAVFALGAD